MYDSTTSYIQGSNFEIVVIGRSTLQRRDELGQRRQPPPGAGGMPQMLLLSGSYLLPPVVNGDAGTGVGRWAPEPVLFGGREGETF
jgi:hypothetical protein